MPTLDKNEDQKFFRIHLNVCGDDLVPDEITAGMGVAPTQIQLKGEALNPRTRRTAPTNRWSFSCPLPMTTPPVEQIEWMLQLLELRLEWIRGLQRSYRLEFFCGYGSANGQGGFVLSAELLRRLAECGIPWELDLYPPESLDAQN